MISELIRYSAVSAKTRAMYGKLLTPAQWESLLAAENLEELRERLKRSPAWDSVGDVPAESAAMCRALTLRLESDCHRLGCFLPSEDKALFETFLRYQKQAEPMTPEEYQRWWSSAGKRSESLCRIAGAEADALNLVYLLRLRQFPKSLPAAKKYLIPIHRDLKPALIDRLLKAPDDRAVLAILEETRWGATFRSLAPGELENQYQQYMTDFCRHILRSANASFAVVQAFLPLKDMERRRLMSLVGAVARGKDPRAVIGTLTPGTSGGKV